MVSEALLSAASQYEYFYTPRTHSRITKEYKVEPPRDTDIQHPVQLITRCILRDDVLLWWQQQQRKIIAQQRRRLKNQKWLALMDNKSWFRENHRRLVQFLREDAKEDPAVIPIIKRLVIWLRGQEDMYNKKWHDDSTAAGCLSTLTHAERAPLRDMKWRPFLLKRLSFYLQIKWEPKANPEGRRRKLYICLRWNGPSK